MRRHLITAIALTLTAASTASAQNCPNSTVVRYGSSLRPQTRTVYLPTSQVATIRFGGRLHLPELAADLYKQSNTICWEMHHNYQGNLEFHETYAEMYKIMQDTKHVFDLVNRSATLGGGDEECIAADLHEMDALFHHIEDDVAVWRTSSRSRHYHARAGLSGKMAQFEDTLHHLMEDYGVLSQVGAEAPAPLLNSPPAPAPLAPLQPARFQSSGPTFGTQSTPLLPLDSGAVGSTVQPTYRNNLTGPAGR